MKRRKARKTATRFAKRVAKGSRGGAAPAPTMPRDVLRKLAKVLPSTVSTMRGEEYGADGARRLSGNHKHPAAMWWVALLRLAREARGMKLREVAERTGLKRQAFYYIERSKRSPRLDSVLREADAIELRICAVAFTADLWRAGHAVPFARVVRAVEALWRRLSRRIPAGNGAGGG